MKVLILSEGNSSHTIKWVNSLVRNQMDIVLFSLSAIADKDVYDSRVKIYASKKLISKKESTLSKLGYLLSIPKIRRIITIEKPMVVHAHYASSYGLLGAILAPTNFVVSVWGSDIFSFPQSSFLNRAIVKFVFRKADKILSTSHVMAREVNLYTSKRVEVTPFGVDLDIYKPQKVESFYSEDDIVIGTVKTLESIYGIEYLIKAFKILKDKYPNKPLKLLIVGGGSLKEPLKKLTRDLQIEDESKFVGAVPYQETSNYHNMLSISVSVSNNESFGVAIIEASACGKPVVVSNVGGLPEVVQNGTTGFIVPPKNAKATAEAIEKLVLNPTLREKMGRDGRMFVKDKYEWGFCVTKMINIYNSIQGLKLEGS